MSNPRLAFISNLLASLLMPSKDGAILKKFYYNHIPSRKKANRVFLHLYLPI